MNIMVQNIIIKQYKRGVTTHYIFALIHVKQISRAIYAKSIVNNNNLKIRIKKYIYLHHHYTTVKCIENYGCN